MSKKSPQRTDRDYIVTLLQTRTQKQVSELLGIGERTIRRIKNEPNHRTINRTKTVISTLGALEVKRARRERLRDEAREIIRDSKADTAARKEAVKKGVSALKKRGATPEQIAKFKRESAPRKPPKKVKKAKRQSIPDVAVIPPHKRVTRRSADDETVLEFTGAIAFDVRKIDIEQIQQLIAGYRDAREGYQFRIVYGVPKGQEYEIFDGEKRIGRKRYKLDSRSGTEWEPLKSLRGKQSPWSDAAIADLLKSKLLKRKKSARHNFQFVYFQKL